MRTGNHELHCHVFIEKKQFLFLELFVHNYFDLTLAYIQMFYIGRQLVFVGEGRLQRRNKPIPPAIFAKLIASMQFVVTAFPTFSCHQTYSYAMLYSRHGLRNVYFYSQQAMVITPVYLSTYGKSTTLSKDIKEQTVFKKTLCVNHKLIIMI